jgi:hypothetical protein
VLVLVLVLVLLLLGWCPGLVLDLLQLRQARQLEGTRLPRALPLLGCTVLLPQFLLQAAGVRCLKQELLKLLL